MGQAARFNCWAAELGGCGTRSLEHVISKGLFGGVEVEVEGFNWCRGTPRRIPLERFASHILCAPHNNALSPVDAEASRIFAQLREFQRTLNVRGRRKPRLWTVKRYVCSGLLLERWFLKTMINLCTVRPDAQTLWSGDRSPMRQPPLDLVRAAFGQRPLTEPMGLYAAASIGEVGNSVDAVHFAPLLARDEVIAGIFTLRGIRFLLSLLPKKFPDRLQLPNAPGAWRASELLFHIRNIRNVHGRYLSQVLEFRW